MRRTRVALLAIVDCFTKESYLAASLGIRFLTGILSCIVAQGVYVWRRGAMRRVLADMAAVARRLEASADPGAQVRHQWTHPPFVSLQKLIFC